MWAGAKTKATDRAARADMARGLSKELSQAKNAAKNRGGNSRDDAMTPAQRKEQCVSCSIRVAAKSTARVVKRQN